MLTQAKTMREQEIFEYQINIDNFKIALQNIAAMPAEERQSVSEFEAQLSKLLNDNLREQKKAQIMLDAINAQL
jgi:hypothetical protein